MGVLMKSMGGFGVGRPLLASCSVTFLLVCGLGASGVASAVQSRDYESFSMQAKPQSGWSPVEEAFGSGENPRALLPVEDAERDPGSWASMTGDPRAVDDAETGHPDHRRIGGFGDGNWFEDAGRWDNRRVVTSSVPEVKSSVLMLVGIAALAIGLNRRKRYRVAAR